MLSIRQPFTARFGERWSSNRFLSLSLAIVVAWTDAAPMMSKLCLLHLPPTQIYISIRRPATAAKPSRCWTLNNIFLYIFIQLFFLFFFYFHFCFCIASYTMAARRPSLCTKDLGDEKTISICIKCFAHHDPLHIHLLQTIFYHFFFFVRMLCVSYRLLVVALFKCGDNDGGNILQKLQPKHTK